MLENKKILFLTPEFYSYPVLIKNSLASMGASVDIFYSRPTGLLGKILKIFPGRRYEMTKDRYFKKLLPRTGNFYDYILIIRADLIPLKFLLHLKDKFRNANFIHYIWDDISLFPEITKCTQYFDKTLSYNLSDCQKYGFVFRPFFFVKTNESKKSQVPNKNKIFFIGSYHSDRLRIIELVRSLNPQIKFHFHLYINPIIYILSGIQLKKLKYFRFWKMNYSMMLKEIGTSVAVLDVQNISQAGLTTRVFEALGAGSKVITVNESILRYDFYNTDNILLINRSFPKIEKNWLDVPFKPYDEASFKKYNIEEWIKDVFGIIN